MRAITDIPANTANPMGRTERCRPGSMNVAAEDEDAAAADGVDFPAPPGCVAAPPALSGAAVGVAMMVGSALDSMVVKPLILAGIGPVGCVIGLDMADVDAEVLSLVDESVGAPAVLLVDVDVEEDSTEVVVDVEVTDDVDPVEDDGVEAEDVAPGTSVEEDVVSVDDGALEELVLEFDKLLPGSTFPEPLSNSVTVHDCTSCTAGLPFASVIGVRVMVHVWVIGPATV